MTWICSVQIQNPNLHPNEMGPKLSLWKFSLGKLFLNKMRLWKNLPSTEAPLSDLLKILTFFQEKAMHIQQEHVDFPVSGFQLFS